MSVDASELREIGRIVSAHGVAGEMKVAPETDDPTRYMDLNSVWVGQDEQSSSIFDIRSVRIQPSKYGTTIVMALDGIETRDQASDLRQLRIFAHEKDLPALQPGEYFLSDLLEMEVWSTEGAMIGQVRGVYELPAQNVLLVERDDGSECMIPAIPEFLTEIDFERSHITVSVIEGMIE